MLLTQLSTVKARLGIGDSVDDTMLTDFIAACSGRFERECNRRFERTVNATFEFPADSVEVVVDRFPIEAVSSFDLKTTESEGWIPQTLIDYIIYKGCVVSLLGCLGTARQIGRVTYTGGYILPGGVPSTGQTTLPDEIAVACQEQVAYWYQNRNRLGLVSVAGEGGAIQQFAQLDLLPSVKAVLKSHERFAL